MRVAGIVTHDEGSVTTWHVTRHITLPNGSLQPRPHTASIVPRNKMIYLHSTDVIISVDDVDIYHCHWYCEGQGTVKGKGRTSKHYVNAGTLKSSLGSKITQRVFTTPPPLSPGDCRLCAMLCWRENSHVIWLYLCCISADLPPPFVSIYLHFLPFPHYSGMPVLQYSVFTKQQHNKHLFLHNSQTPAKWRLKLATTCLLNSTLYLLMIIVYNYNI